MTDSIFVLRTHPIPHGQQCTWACPNPAAHVVLRLGSGNPAVISYVCHAHRNEARDEVRTVNLASAKAVLDAESRAAVATITRVEPPVLTSHEVDEIVAAIRSKEPMTPEEEARCVPYYEEQLAPTGDGTEILPLVIADLQRRGAMGLRKYGTPLRAGNGRNALRDAYEECQDMALYLRQAIEERAADGDLVEALERSNVAIAQLIAERDLARDRTDAAQNAVIRGEVEIQQLRRTREAIEHERNQATSMLASIGAERDAAVLSRDTVNVALDNTSNALIRVLNERDEAERARDAAFADLATVRETRDNALSHRDAALAQIAAAERALDEKDRTEEVIDQIVDWQSVTFGARQTLTGAVKHLEREIKEIGAATVRWSDASWCGTATDAEAARSHLAEELTDAVFLIVQAFTCLGYPAAYTLRQNLIAKLAKNRARKWGPTDADGVTEHVREPSGAHRDLGPFDMKRSLGTIGEG